MPDFEDKEDFPVTWELLPYSWAEMPAESTFYARGTLWCIYDRDFKEWLYYSHLGNLETGSRLYRHVDGT